MGAGRARSDVFLPQPLWVLGLGFQPGVYSMGGHIHDSDGVCPDTCLSLQVSSGCSPVLSGGALTLGLSSLGVGPLRKGFWPSLWELLPLRTGLN